MFGRMVIDKAFHGGENHVQVNFASMASGYRGPLDIHIAQIEKAWLTPRTFFGIITMECIDLDRQVGVAYYS